MTRSMLAVATAFFVSGMMAANAAHIASRSSHEVLAIVLNATIAITSAAVGTMKLRRVAVKS